MNDDDLPGMLALAKGVAEQRWPHTTDAKAWVGEWLKAVKERPEIATDEATMLAWFANAIMAGYDTASSIAAKAVREGIHHALNDGNAQGCAPK